ncbi:Repeat domain-containing protein [Rhodovulum sp. ES.010]|uniref:FG-GAP repeat domain-containing protein n=1 Tax=Rhodovulum sp. ES.010 TaxID=1882821 RepID=UPI000926380B|nr:VCBS repeat-containing protein [Rhodovulum sp. ES.010]SIO33326.1 Repeat domain-containing protein [Rhodovulum sp. ES.010]
MRGAALLLAALLAAPASADIVSARYAEPTTRYDHGVLGDAVEWGALELRLADGTAWRIVLPRTRVFEDTAPRLVDLDGDGAPEVIVVESHIDLGARLSVYGADGLIAATPFIGTRHRWLAPVGAADLDGDGRTEIAWIDRPHLARILRVWRLQDGRLREIAIAEGLTNHRVGDEVISGGLRDCGTGAEMVLAAPDWSRILLARLVEDRIETLATTLPATRAGFRKALACRS